MTGIPIENDIDLDDTQFYNRINEISFLYNYLDTVRNGSTPAVLLTGVRGVGKTALIKKLKRKLKNDYLTVYIDLSSIDRVNNGKINRTAFMELVYESIMNECYESELITINKKVEKFFKTNKFKIDTILTYKEIPIPIIKTEQDYSKFANFVMNLPQKINEEYERIKGVFIFIDEFQLIKNLDEELNSFLWYIRSVVQSSKNV